MRISATPDIVHAETYNLPLTNERLPDFTNQDWWNSVSHGEFQLLPEDPSDPTSFAAVSYDELGRLPTATSSRVSSNSDWVRMASKEAIQNMRIVPLIAVGKIRLKIYSHYLP